MKKLEYPPEERAEERDRLEATQPLAILDTSPDEYFERLTRMAKRLFGVPIAFVSLADKSERGFNSCIGLREASEAPQEDVCFYGREILGHEIFIVPNAQEDERFADNPLVAGEPHIRFYAGCPLRAFDGRRLGTLCIIDREPRNLDRADLETLADLVSMAEHELAAFQLATLDELTNVSNRRGFTMLAQHSLRLCARQGISAALVFMDLDRFKSINDTFGHAEGDRALTVFANLMRNTCRDSDLFARLGGDEFAALLVNTSDTLAQELVDRFSRSMEKYNRSAGRGYEISFSYGIVGFDPEKHHTIDDLLAEGDALMYAIKHGKR